MIIIKAEMTEEQAEALSQFLKRIGWNEYRELATSDEDAYNMRDAGEILRASLVNAGFAPR